jgi:N4-(beta-N-acetylglucosaminyl)-L-asparaginase
MKVPGVSRREVLQQGIVAGASVSPLAKLLKLDKPQGKPRILAVSSGNGMRAVTKAVELMKEGEDTLEAAVSGVSIVEEDPNDMSVGYGGLPNEDGVVQLDACVMHGPTYNAGAVGALENTKNAARVAKTVMERTDHIFLVGKGATEFAKMHGFEEVDMLTERARQAWVRWKERLSQTDDYIDPAASEFLDPRPTGTITCLTLNEAGDMSGTTTTSGLAFKIPSRVGDSPLIGCGCYVDNAVGACGSTGRGEANILINGSRTVVENMRHGMGPEEACLDVVKRICAQTVEKRLLDEPGKPNFQLQFYAITKDGRHGGASIKGGSRYAVHDGKEARMVGMASAF